MFESMPQEASHDDDQHVRELSERNGRLRDLIIILVERDKDTRRHSEKLFGMLRELRAAKLVAAIREAGGAPQPDHGHPGHPGAADKPHKANA